MRFFAYVQRVDTKPLFLLICGLSMKLVIVLNKCLFSSIVHGSVY